MPNNNNEKLVNVLNKLVCQQALERTPFSPHPTATSHRYEGIRFCEAKKDDPTSWTACDTARALRDVPFDDFLGLKFYRVDPLPFLFRYMAEQPNQKAPRSLLFVDHEFPTHNICVAVDTCTRRLGTVENLLPGILASSNCRDFANAAEAKRQERIPHYCKLAQSCSWQRKGVTAPLFSALEADNIQQGKIGNCGFCSAFASLVQGWPEWIQRAFGPHSEEALANCGAYSVKLFPQGRERYLLLDDHLLRNNTPTLGKPPSLQSRQGDTWIEYLEKVFVKVQGSYAGLDGHYKHNSLYRHPARAIQLLTGAPIAMEVYYNVRAKKNSLQHVYQVLLASQGRYARVAHCRTRCENLIPNHGYSLLWIGEAKDQRLVCLRNPHGRGSYRGKYGCGWNWKAEDRAVLEELQRRPFFQRISLGCPIAGADNGIFLMEFQVFAQCFPIVTIVGPMDCHSAGLGNNAQETTMALLATPECIYRSKPATLGHVKALLETANR